MNIETRRIELLRAAVATIAEYSDPQSLRESAEEEYGLDPEEAIEMAYENVLQTARECLHQVDRLTHPPAPAPGNKES